MTARSWLFVPGDSNHKIAKSAALGADARIIDLEDAVSPSRKSEARVSVAKWLTEQSEKRDVWIRVNNTPDLLESDLRAVLVDGVAGIVLPKTKDGAQAHQVGELIKQVAPHKGVGFIPMIETARAVMEAGRIAKADQVKTLLVGEFDLAAELGLHLSEGHPELQTARSMVVLACSAAGVESPIGPVSSQLNREGLFLSSTQRLRAEGHFGRAVIHPSQIGPANLVFTPSSEELSNARSLVESFEKAAASGLGVSVDEGGALIDEAIVRLARRSIEIARRVKEETL